MTIISANEDKTTARRILGRFGHLLSSQVVEALSSLGFFLYLAWLDASSYGEIMYAMAAGAMVMKVVQFGLYYPLVRQLGTEQPDRTVDLLGRVSVIKLFLVFPSLIVVWGITAFRGLSSQMSLIVLLVCLGFALEALADTFFADLRVRSRQDREAKIKVVGSLTSYGFGFLAAALTLSPVLVGSFKVISGLVRLALAGREHFRAMLFELKNGMDLTAVWTMFRAASVFALIEILGIFYNKANVFFLEQATGVTGVAYYSATWNLIDSVSVVASESFLGWVIFPLLASIWWKSRQKARELIRANSLWLLVTAFPIMFVLAVKSDFIIGLIYPGQYKDAVWMQQYLVWTIVLSFQNNLFAYVMMVSGAQRILLAFALVATSLNLIFNITLVGSLGLAGGCLVIILTKLAMTILTFGYCQIRFALFKWRDLYFPGILAGVSLVMFFTLKLFLPLPGLWVLIFYVIVVWKKGVKSMGAPRRVDPSKMLRIEGPDLP